MLCRKHKYNLDEIINRCLEFYDTKINKKCIFLMNSSVKL